MSNEISHWADQIAARIIHEKGKKARYVCAAGITPSGTVHIGNFREIITVDLVSKALKDIGKKVRFIYSWDDYDRFRKIPSNMKNPEVLRDFIGKPIIDTPDTYGCHKSYAEHNEKGVENVLPKVGVKPEFIYQSKKYRKSEYKDEIKFLINNKEKIIKILNNYRKEPLNEDWYPVSIFCKKCGKDTTKVIDYDGKYKLKYECECGNKEETDFSKEGNVKLLWRVDWPMRWHHEKVDFEPGGKEHSTPGGSLTTAREIIDELYNEEPPIYQPYDFIIVKGKGGKMSSSLGNVITLKDALDIYEPEIIRYLFAGTRPNTEFFISFDLDVLKNYEDFDRLERVYFKKEKVKESKYNKLKRIYELSCIKIPKNLPYQPSFRHLTNVVQIFENNFNQIRAYYDLKDKEDIEKLKERVVRVKNWLEKYAEEDFKFKVNDEDDIKKLEFNDKEKKVIKLLKEKLRNDYDEESLFQEFYEICKEKEIDNKEFFKLMYKALINKERGPKLAAFILAIGKERVVKLLGSVE